MALVKVDDTHVAEIGTQQVKRIYSSTELADRKAALQADIDKITALQAILTP